jgi:hypothetical protein
VKARVESLRWHAAWPFARYWNVAFDRRLRRARRAAGLQPGEQSELSLAIGLQVILAREGRLEALCGWVLRWLPPNSSRMEV